MQAMMTPALPQITWQHCTHPVEATDLQIPEEGAHEAGTRAECCSPPRASGTVQCEQGHNINILAARNGKCTHRHNTD